MSAADAVAFVLFAAILLYAVFGGADFGSGVWDLAAGSAARGAPLRRLVDHSIGPVWEANHVWLVFVLVLLWSGFPEPFALLMRDLGIPFWFAGLGIVARGAAFAFRKFAATLTWARTAGIVFAAGSLATPFFLGTIAGAIASGRVGGAEPASSTVWLGPTSILGGVLAVVTCTFMAGTLLAAEAESLGKATLAEQLRMRSLIGGGVAGIVVAMGIVVLLADAPELVDGLLGRALPVVAISGITGSAAMWLLWQRRLRSARLAAGVAVASVVAGWGIAQYPWLLVGEVTIEEGAGAQATLIGLLVAAGLALVVVVPPLLYLYSLADTNVIGSEHER
ncbi:MAG: cytochrome d ubiquinol oxidase subunit II [Acidimicrobiales bacterium]